MNNLNCNHKKLTVVKCNELIEAGYKLSIYENRLLLICISRIDSTKELDIRHPFTINCKDIMDLAGVGKHTAYEGMRDGAIRLFNRQINIDINSKRHLKMRWVSSVEYCEYEGEVKLRFSQEIAPYISELSRNFTQYKLVNVMMFRSNYSIRVYELLMKWAGSNKVIEIEKVRMLFGLEDKYSKLNDFKKRVIDVAMKEINEFSDITASYTQIKRGRTITAFKFEWHSKKTTKTKAMPYQAKKTMTPAQYERLHPQECIGKSTEEVKAMIRGDASNTERAIKHGGKSDAHIQGMQSISSILDDMTPAKE